MEENNWMTVYVSAYSGGELEMEYNIGISSVMNILSRDAACLDDYEGRWKELTDEELLKIWCEWYSKDEYHKLYAGDSYSEIQVFRIKNNIVCPDFPSNEEILKYLKNVIGLNG